MAAEAIDLDRYVDILELFPILELCPADSLQAVTITYALSHLWPDEDFTSFGNICQTSRQVGDCTTGRERPPRSTHTLKTSRTDQGDTGVEAHMHCERLHGILGVECLGSC